MDWLYVTGVLNVLLVCFAVVSANFGKPPTLGANQQFGGKAQIQDKEHLQEHLQGVVNPEETYSEEEMQFHYFQAHDSDNNNKLDGTELIAALTHYHKDTDDTHHAITYTDEELINAVDGMLYEEDTNLDGYIDYPEFLMAKRQNFETL